MRLNTSQAPLSLSARSNRQGCRRASMQACKTRISHALASADRRRSPESERKRRALGFMKRTTNRCDERVTAYVEESRNSRTGLSLSSRVAMHAARERKKEASSGQGKFCRLLLTPLGTTRKKKAKDRCFVWGQKGCHGHKIVGPNA